MNPFQSSEISWDDPIRHICSFLPGEDLLNLSEVDKSFNKIITESKAAMEKIRLVLEVGLNDLQLDDVIELAAKRHFGAIKLVGVNESFAQHDKLSTLLSSLDSAEDIIIEECQFEENQFHEIIQAVLPKLKRCELTEVELATEEESNAVEPLERSDTNHPLEHLMIDKSADGHLKFFAECKQLKTFVRSPGDPTDDEAVSDFLTQQAQLKKLAIICYEIDWSRMICFQLEELTALYTDELDLAEDFSTFLKKLTSLKKLHIVMCRLSRRVMEVICNAPKLESLTIYVRHFPNATPQAAGDVMAAPNGLFNNTVKKLGIYDQAGVSGCLLKMFRGAESIDLLLNFQALDLSDVPYETIEKIEMEVHKQADSQTFHVVFSPAVVPENVEGFESVVLGFAEKCSARVHGITIGNETWLSNAEFRLSNSFCKRLVSALPQLELLQLFNVADRAAFESFLTANRLDFKIHASFDDEDFVSKPMNIESD